MNRERVTIQWLLQTAGREKIHILWLILGNVLAATLSISLALLMEQLIDHAVGGDLNGFILYCVWLGSVVIFQPCLRGLLRHQEIKVISGFENMLKERLYRTLLDREYASLSAYHSGDLMNRMTSDVAVIAEGMVSLLPTLALMITKLLGASILLALMDWRFTLLFMLSGLFMIGISCSLRSRMKKMHVDVQEKDGRVRSFLQETLEGLLILRSYNAEERALKKAKEMMAEHRKSRMRKAVLSNVSQFGFALALNVGYLFGLVWCGYGILLGTISYGSLVAVQQLIGQIQQPFANLSGLLPRYYAMTASTERLMELERFPQDIRDEVKRTDKELGEIADNFSSICLENITFAYNEQEDNVLENASFCFAKGDYVAVIGESGIGKSTLLKLLLALYPNYEGQIKIIMGHAPEPLLLDAGCRKLFAYVPQGNGLMSGSIAEAVAFLRGPGEDDVSLDRIKEACTLACADEFIKELPELYNTVLGENGAGLSEGQLQRLAIARAVLTDAPILLLDEATSALDEKTEEKLLQNLKQFTNKTILIVTHRKAALEICNKVIAVKNKELVMMNNRVS